MHATAMNLGWMIALSAVVCAAMSCAAPAHSASVATVADAHETPGVIRVVGSWVVRERPNRAWVSLGVQGAGETAADAQDKVSSAMNAVLSAVRATDADVQQIQTSSLSLSPMYDSRRQREPGQPPRIVGYTASNTITVRMGDVSKIGMIIDAGMKGGANSVNGVRFGLSEESQAEAQRKGLRQAVGQARGKAGVMADAMGMRLGRVVEVIEQGAEPPIPRPMMMRGGAEFAMAADATPVEPGEVESRVQVTIVYELVGGDG